MAGLGQPALDAAGPARAGERAGQRPPCGPSRRGTRWPSSRSRAGRTPAKLGAAIARTLGLLRAYFLALRRRLPRIAHVEIRPKRGRALNELTRLRYDVTLHVAPAAFTPVDPEWVEWDGARLTLEQVEGRLAERRCERLGIRGVPNRRTEGVGDVSRIADGEKDGTEAALRAEPAASGGGGVDPEALWRPGERLGYATHLSWARHDGQGRVDAAFLRSPRASRTVLPRFVSQTRPASAAAAHANDPARLLSQQKLIRDLRVFLHERLPGHPVWLRRVDRL